jgi:folate-dependent phosphoribosylglycinamide formyltransferase PurN
MKAEPSIVIVTSSGPEHWYVANRIAAEIPVRAIIVLDQPKRQVKRYWRAGVGKMIDKVLLGFFLAAVRDARRKALALEQVFGARRSAQCREVGKVLELGSPSTEEMVQAIGALQPDVIAVYGTGKIPQAVLDLAKDQAFNMHTGLSPYYRGTACTFWPIANNEPELVGATVHECTGRIDAGRIFFNCRVSLFRSDDLHTIFARTVVAGAEGYVEVLRSYCEGRLSGVPQNLEIGREYRGTMRGLAAELKARRNLRRLRSGWPELAARGNPESLN